MSTPADISYDEEENEKGFMQDCVSARCRKSLDDSGTIWGCGEASVKRALVTLTETCSCGDTFHYDAEHPPTNEGAPRRKSAPPTQKAVPEAAQAIAPEAHGLNADLIIRSVQFMSKASSRADALSDLRAILEKKAPELQVILPTDALYIGGNIWLALSGLRGQR